MRSFLRISSSWLTICALILLLSGCIGRSSPKVTYYSLLTDQQLGGGESIASLPEIKLGVGPVTIPDSLKRSQVVVREEGNQYEFDEYNRWAGILEKDLTYVLGENLGQLLGINKIGFFPWQHYFKPNYRVMIDVIYLDGSLVTGEAVFNVHWVVADGNKKSLAGDRKIYRQPLEAKTYSALVKAESQLVAQLSRDIAAVIVDLNK